jgi:hypothetical protein
MNRYIHNILILLFPFMFMVLINEVVRLKTKEEHRYMSQGITAINSADFLPHKCTWICHNNTTYCKTHHVKYLKPLYSITDLFYFGVIDLLASTGNYGAANIVFLVFLIPLTILYFIIKSINIQYKIRKLSKHKL